MRRAPRKPASAYKPLYPATYPLFPRPPSGEPSFLRKEHTTSVRFCVLAPRSGRAASGQFRPFRLAPIRQFTALALFPKADE